MPDLADFDGIVKKKMIFLQIFAKNAPSLPVCVYTTREHKQIPNHCRPIKNARTRLCQGFRLRPGGATPRPVYALRASPRQAGRRGLREEPPLIRCRLTAPHPLRGQTRFAVCPIRLTAPQAARPSGGRRRLWRVSTPRVGGVTLVVSAKGDTPRAYARGWKK